jgi:hypothetical protein
VHGKQKIGADNCRLLSYGFGAKTAGAQVSVFRRCASAGVSYQEQTSAPLFLSVPIYAGHGNMNWATGVDLPPVTAGCLLCFIGSSGMLGFSAMNDFTQRPSLPRTTPGAAVIRFHFVRHFPLFSLLFSSNFGWDSSWYLFFAFK